MTINSQGEWANAIEDAEQVMLRWGHGQVRRVPDEIAEAIVAALRAPVSERLPIPDEIRGEWTPRRCLHLGQAAEITALCRFLNGIQSNERPDSTKEKK